MPGGYMYLMCNHKRGTIYTGSTCDIVLRDIEHKDRANPNSFTARYDCLTLVYFEAFDTLADARARERAVKRYKRVWKIEMIERNNPEWKNIALDWDD